MSIIIDLSGNITLEIIMILNHFRANQQALDELNIRIIYLIGNNETQEIIK